MKEFLSLDQIKELNRRPRIVSRVKAPDPHVPEYFRLVGGEEASMNIIKSQNHFMNKAVESMVKAGVVVGQNEFQPQPDGSLVFDIKLHKVGETK